MKSYLDSVIKSKRRFFIFFLKSTLVAFLLIGISSCSDSVQFEKDYFKNIPDQLEINSIFSGYFLVNSQNQNYLLSIQEQDSQFLVIDEYDSKTFRKKNEKKLYLKLVKLGSYYLGKMNLDNSDPNSYFIIKISLNDLGFDSNFMFLDLNPELFTNAILNKELDGEILEEDNDMHEGLRKIVIKASLNDFMEFINSHINEIEEYFKENSETINFRRIESIDDNLKNDL